ncbi:multiple epidermal growth factor-like domains protein 10 isoform X1 [Haliotis cracherodii]|uniref:multiple epidermal growth factor-like domains protein 10 isoform X1 n=1 Tax=Haliotis cracherodii TaxID=6455 RepID=UPI0039EC12EC
MMTMEGVIPLLLLLLCFTSAADSQDCPKGRYGISCSLQCTNCQNEKCQKSTGECDNCKHGFYGKRCNETCSPNCRKNTACNRTNGHCDDGCLPSYWGGMCDRNCSQMCNNSVCMHYSGKCHLGCEDGWTGFYCNISCQTVCVNTACAQITDKCIECKNNNGGQCENSKSCFNVCEQCNKDGECTGKRSSESNVAAIVGGVVVAILMVLTVAVVTCRKWFCKPKGQEPEAETTPQSDAGHFLLENSSKVGL